MITMYFDGSISRNPGGIMGMGVVIYKDATIIHTLSESSPATPNNTNNVAECLALIYELTWLIENGYTKDIKVFGDSQIIINKMFKGSKKVPKGNFSPYMIRCQKLRVYFTNIQFSWISREHNTIADELSTNYNI